MRICAAVSRRQAGAFGAAALVAAALVMTLERGPSRAERDALAARFSFTALEVPEPEGVQMRTRRAVHPALEHLSGWISSVGAAVALSDLDGDGLPNDLCIVDPRTDRVTVQPVPGTGMRYPPVELEPSPLPYDVATMAPMGCVPGDLDEDGRLDVVVYYWGRTPVAFLCTQDEAPAYRPCELVPGGGRWFTNACTRADLDGDGHADLVFGNYFADEARILDARAEGGADEAAMHDSMAHSESGGRNRILLWCPAAEAVAFREAKHVLPGEFARRWTLAVGAADLDGDLLPELYFANDFGPDVLLHNRSTSGALTFAELTGRRRFTTARSCALGRDSFKGMGIDFGDLNGDGLLDLYVSNITAEWGLQEYQMCFLSTGRPEVMADGEAPYVNRAEELGLARSGWAWEARLADFDNDGVLEALQATGFVRGATDRWPELHEVAMANDHLLASPGAWHRVAVGDDLSGRSRDPFWVRAGNGRFVDLAGEVGLDDDAVTRGLATADFDGDGDLDLAVARQWQAPRCYRNDAPAAGAFLGLHLRLPLAPARTTQALAGHPSAERPSRAAIGASAEVLLPDGRRLVAQVDGGNGHSGVRSADLHFGLGACRQPVDVRLAWRDPAGAVHREKLRLAPGWHTVTLAWPVEKAQR